MCVCVCVVFASYLRSVCLVAVLVDAGHFNCFAAGSIQLLCLLVVVLV